MYKDCFRPLIFLVNLKLVQYVIAHKFALGGGVVSCGNISMKPDPYGNCYLMRIGTLTRKFVFCYQRDYFLTA